MWLDLVIFMGIPVGLAVLALTFGVDTRDGNDWITHRS